jgi:hypothetical protein
MDQLEQARGSSQFYIEEPNSFKERASVIQQLMKDRMFSREFYLLEG